tara:strand:- start:271 stop:750 length:480 start_codon:yes stop_codon:yes gene_type:complete
MTDTETINIDKQKLFNLAANLLVAFIKQPPEQAKKVFKQLKQETVVKSGELTSEKNGTKIDVKLELDRKEFKGPFNYPSFEHALRALVQRFQTEARKDKELKEVQTLTNENTGGLLFNLPAGIEIDGQMNVLMAAVEPLVDAVVVKLIFVDPAQFEIPE